MNHKSLISYLLSLILLASCTTPNTTGDHTLCVTIEPLRMFTQAIAGDQYDVVSIVPSGTSPETYDPAPQQLVLLAHSQAYFMAGHLGFELTWIDRLKDNNPDLPFFDTSTGIQLIRETHHHEGHTHPGGVEPHVWNSASNALLIADNICQGLSQIDPANATLYAHRRDSLKQVIDRTDAQVREILADTHTPFLIYHPALSYFARDYGLRQISIEEQGKEPSPSQLQRLIEQCREENVRVIFVQQEFDVRNAQLIANEIGLEVIPINPLSYDWAEEMIHIANALSPNSDQ